jgi:copper(I)-binding protein
VATVFALLTSARTASNRWSARIRPTRRLAATLGLGSVLLVTGCAANFGAPTQHLYQPAVGSNYRDGDVYVLDAQVVANDQGDGTLVTTIINQAEGSDFLVEVTTEDADGGGVETGALPAASSSDCSDVESAPSTGICLPSQQAVALPADGQIQVQADTVTPGTFVTMTLRFQNGSPVELDVPVVAEGPMYTGVTVAPVTEDSASTSPSSSPTP